MTSILNTTRLIAAQQVARRTLLVSSRGPDIVSKLEVAGPATWWANFDASLSPLLEGTDEAQFVENTHDDVAGTTSSGELIFDLIVVDWDTGVNSIVEFLEGVARSSEHYTDSVVICRDTALQEDVDPSLNDLVESLAGAGWFRTPSNLLAVEGLTGVFTRCQPTLSELAANYEQILEKVVNNPARGRGQLHAVCANIECHASIEAARSAALQDRDRLAGMFARVINLQYEIEHLRIVVNRSRSDLRETRAGLRAARRALKKTQRTRTSRLKRAVTNPMRAGRSPRGSAPGALTSQKKLETKKQLS